MLYFDVFKNFYGQLILRFYCDIALKFQIKCLFQNLCWCCNMAAILYGPYCFTVLTVTVRSGIFLSKSTKTYFLVTKCAHIEDLGTARFLIVPEVIWFGTIIQKISQRSATEISKWTRNFSFGWAPNDFYNGKNILG